jgi:subtilisin family serine protease
MKRSTVIGAVLLALVSTLLSSNLPQNLPSTGSSSIQALSANAADQTRTDAQRDPRRISAHRVIVRFDTARSSAPLSPDVRAVLASLGASISTLCCDGRLSLVTLAPEVDVAAALARLSALPGVRYAVPDDVVTLAVFNPNDAQFPAQWALKNTAGVDIGATLAWDQTTGSSTTLVAVMDTGIDYRHPDLYLSIAINQGEIPASLKSQIVDTNGNGLIDFYDLNSLDANGNVVLDASGQKYNRQFVTDHNGNGYIDAGDLLFAPWTTGTDKDGNGLVDDIVGWDHLGNSNNPMDSFGHGTHVASTIGARGNNETGIAGVNWRVRILPERFHAGDGGTISDAIKAINHAVSQGARVINSSWGTTVNNPALRDAVDWAGQQGVVVVAAAGNNSSNINNPQVAYYPAAYNLTNLISVASVDLNGNLSGFSNFGSTTVHLAAPGENILGAAPGNGYAMWNGTSMSTAHVTGVVSLLAGLFPNASPQWLVNRTLATVRPLASLSGKTITGGMLDAFAAVNTTNTAGPRVLMASPIGDTATPTDRVTLTFDRAITASTFTTADVSLTGPSGSITPSSVSQISSSVFDVVFPTQTASGTYQLTVGPAITDTTGQAMDQDRDGLAGETVQDRFSVVFRQVPPPQVWSVDRGSAGYSASSGWTTYTGVGAGGSFDYKQAGSGSETVTWTFGNLTPGLYRVSATWEPYSNRVVDAPYTVLDGTTPLATVLVNQQLAPADFSANGVSWQDLGGPYPIVGDTLVVKLSDVASPAGNYLIADAVRVERVGGPTPVPSLTVLVDGAPLVDGTSTVAFGTTTVGAPVSKTVTVRNDGGANLTLGTITLPSGFSLTAGFGSTTLTPSQTTSFTVRFDAATVGAFAGSISFASNDTTKNPFDFAVTGTANANTAPQVWTIDDGTTGYTTTGTWSTYSGAGASGDFAYKTAGSGAATATWTFTGLPSGLYRVSTTWQAFSNRAINAPYTVLGGTTALATVMVNQQTAPATFTESGILWQDLGGPYPIYGDTLAVRLTDLATPAGSIVVADSVRIERVGSIVTGPSAEVLVNGTAVADGTGSVDFGATTVGAPVSKTITVRNGGTSDLTLGAIAVPAGFSLVTGFGVTTLPSGQTTTFVVRLDAAAAGSFSGSLSFVTNDAARNPFDFAVTGTASSSATPQVWTIDDGTTGYTTTGTWSTYSGAGAGGDFAYKASGSGAGTATWTFTGLTPGIYRVSATWQAYTNRVSNAPYTVLNGTTVMGTVLMNQQQAPADFTAEGQAWEDLGGPYVFVGETLVVRLTDSATPSGNYVIADAVRVERIGSLTGGPDIEVVVNSVPVADGTGSVDFGSTVVGAPVSRTFTIRNAGGADLTLGAITVPAGFSLVAGFGSTTLAPGQTTSFALQMNAAAVGAYSGTVSFVTNDPSSDPFDFTVTGTTSVIVTPQVWTIDNGAAGFSTVGTWTVYNGAGLEGDFAYKRTGNGNSTATWTFTGLVPGQYRVSATWQAFTNRVNNASYTVLAGTTPLATVAVNQQQVPSGFTEGGQSWQNLGGLYTLQGDTLVVRLKDSGTPSGNYVVADAVRVERIGN